MAERLYSRRTVLKGLSLVPIALAIGCRPSLGSQNLSTTKEATSTMVNCLPLTPSIIFETEFNQNAKDQIEAVFRRLPPYVQNKISTAGYSVDVLASEADVEARYGDSAGGVADYSKKKIVIGSPLDFPHELGHVVDFEFGFLSISPEFIGPEIQARKSFLSRTDQAGLKDRMEAEIKSTDDQTVKELFTQALADMDKGDALLTKAEAMLNLSQTQIAEQLLTDRKLLDLFMHLYTPGFEKYYSLEEDIRRRFQEDDPELYAAFDNFDNKMRSLC